MSSQVRFRMTAGLFSKAALLSVAAGATAVHAQNQSNSTSLPKIQVETQEEESYVVQSAGIGAKGGLDVRDVPQSVTVFNEELIRDLAPRSLDDLADYVAGVDRENAVTNPYAISFFFRGFGTSGNGSSYNGYRESGFNTPQAAINIDRIEFLKGPASVLAGGNGALSGLVNIVSKRPLAESFHRIEASAGSFDHLVGSLDSTGSITSDGGLRYRLTASVDKDGNFVNDTDQQSLFISPYVSWDIGENTQLDVELLDQEIDRAGLASYFERYPEFFDLPVDIQLGDPGVSVGSGGDLTRRLARVDFTHRFANGWKLRQGVFIHNVRNDDSSVTAFGYNPTTHLSARSIRTIDQYQRERTSQTGLSGESTTGSLRHQWLGGVEVSRQKDGRYSMTFRDYSPIDIFNPTYPGTPLSATPSWVAQPFENEDRVMAGYLQDLISLGGGFKVLAGLRYDSLETISWSPFSTTSQTDRDTSPRLGVLYQPNDQLTWYASWNRSFAPNGADGTGKPFDPQRGEQYEAGLKVDLARGLAMNAAVFEYTRQNVLTSDPLNPFTSIAVGEQRSRGFEAESMGRVTRDWSIVATYTYLDAEVTKDLRLPVGDRLASVPRHSASLFNRFNLQALGLPRWSLTAAVVYTGERESGLPNDPDGVGPRTAASVRLPDTTQIDAGIVYRDERLEMRLNGHNLTNEKLYDGYNTVFMPRAPRSAELSVAVSF